MALRTDLAGELLELATDAARTAGELLAARFGGPATGIDTKSTRTDLVSDADRDAERVILDRIRGRRPDDRVVAEESGASSAPGAGGVTWHIDPLDGTVNYLWGIPTWCVSIHASDDDGDLAAVVLDPSRGELFTAVPGASRLNGDRLAMPPSSDLGDALIATGFAYDAAVRDRQAAVLGGVVPRIRDIRRAGSAALDLVWLAAGRVDGYYERGPQIWDWAAGSMIVREAGGEVAHLAPADGMPDGVIAGRPGIVERLRPLVDPLHATQGFRGPVGQRS